MAKATLASEFRKLRESRGVFQKDLAAACEFSATVPWKVEHGRTVRWETIHSMLTLGLKCQPGSPDYENIQRLWIGERQDRSDAAPQGKGKPKLSKATAQALASFRKLLKGRSDDEVQKIIAGATRAAERLSAAPPAPTVASPAPTRRPASGRQRRR